MPGRRRPEKGTFAAHFDELVRHFPHERPALKFGSRKQPKTPKPKVKTPACVNRALLDD